MAAIARTIGGAFCLDNHFSEAGSRPARPNAVLLGSDNSVLILLKLCILKMNAVCFKAMLYFHARSNTAFPRT